MTARGAVGATGAGLLVLAAYMSTILAANWASACWPALSVAGLWVPAGALCAGFVFSLRDLVHTMLGTRGVLAAIVIGIGLSWLVASPQIAVASAVAFAASEVADSVVYAALHTRPRLIAMVGSNAVGFVVDSLLFVPLAFGSWTAVAGHVAAKTAATVIAVAVAVVLAGRRPYLSGFR